jgi:hypothetical protein
MILELNTREWFNTWEWKMWSICKPVLRNFMKYVVIGQAAHIVVSNLYWDYEKKIVDLSIPGYINVALHQFHHPAPTRSENTPHTWNPLVYGAKTHVIEVQVDIPILPPKDETRIQ